MQNLLTPFISLLKQVDAVLGGRNDNLFVVNPQKILFYKQIIFLKTAINVQNELDKF